MSTALAPPISTTSVTLTSFRYQLETASDALYAVLDACNEPLVPVMATSGQHRAISLYRGSAHESHVAISPYLFQVDRRLLDWIYSAVWDKPYGFFARSTADMAAVRKHFRRYLTVELPTGRKALFRFYDPRVLPTFLTNATPREAEEFFGPMSSYFVTSGNAGLTSFMRRKVS